MGFNLNTEHRMMNNVINFGYLYTLLIIEEFA